MKKVSLLIGIILVVILVLLKLFLFLVPIGITKTTAENIYDKYRENFDKFENIANELPDMYITIKEDDYDNQRTNSYIDNIELSTYRVALSEHQINLIEEAGIKELLNFSNNGRPVFNAVIIKDGYIIFRVTSIFGEGIIYSEDGNFDDTFDVYKYNAISASWYYVEFR